MGLGVPAHVILHHIHAECLWALSWAVQISIWDKRRRVHREPDWLRTVHKANSGVPLPGTADDLGRSRRGNRSLPAKKQSVPVTHLSCKFAYYEWWSNKKGGCQREEAGRKSPGSHAANPFQHNCDVGQLHFSPEHLRRVQHGGHIKQPDLCKLRCSISAGKVEIWDWHLGFPRSSEGLRRRVNQPEQTGTCEDPWTVTTICITPATLFYLCVWWCSGTKDIPDKPWETLSDTLPSPKGSHIIS